MSENRIKPPVRDAVKAAGWLAVSGQLGHIQGVLVSDDVSEQTRQALMNLNDVLRQHGGGPEDVVKTNVFLTTMGHFAAMNAVYAEFFDKDHLPARTAVAVKELPLGAQVEIEAWAVVAPGA